MILGTYHFDNPGRDFANKKADDVLTEKRQREIIGLVALVKKFQPTRIALEQTTNEKLNERYNNYLSGKSSLTANEVDHIGFRMAKDLNHKRVFTVDWQGNFDIDRVLKAAADDYAGAHMARDWYERNLKIYANTLRMTESKNERVLVITGDSHVKLLQQFAVESGGFELERASEYLKPTQ